jgi:hypothetical protein
VSITEAHVARRWGGEIDFVEELPPDGERRLMLGVLIDAIRTLHAHRGSTAHWRARRAWWRERAWFQSEDRSALFSFQNICDALGFDAEYIKRYVLRPSPMARPARLRQHAAKAEQSWLQRRRNAATGRYAPVEHRPRRGMHHRETLPLEAGGIKQAVGAQPTDCHSAPTPSPGG